VRAQRGTVPFVVLDGLVVSLLSILVGLYVGLLHGGKLHNLGRAHASWWGLLVVGIVVPMFVSRLDPSHSVALIVLALVSLIAFTRRNRHLLGMGIVAIGVLANLTVVVLNSGMPVRADALVDAGLAESHEVERVEISGVQRLERDGDVAVFLGDVIPLRATKQVLSVGDVVILVGLGTVASNLLRNRTRATTPREPKVRPPQPPRRERHIPDFEPIELVDDEVLLRAGDLQLVGAGHD
jgi:hypothetical protein